MKKTLIVLLVGFALLFFYYLGENELSKPIEYKSDSEKIEKENTIDNETDNETDKKDSNLPSSISNCPNCVYAIFSEENRKLLPGTQPRKDYRTNQYDVLKDEDYKLHSYTKDYRKLIKDVDEDKRYFLGFIIDDNEIIQRAFACGIEKKKPFCVEGTLDSSAYENNKQILLNIFGKYGEKEYKIGCLDGSSFSCNGNNVEADLSKNGGGVLVGDGYNRSIASCTIFVDGYIYCND